MKYRIIFLFIFLIFNIKNISTIENNKIEIIQKTKRNFLFRLDNKDLKEKEIISILTKFPNIHDKYLKAKKAYIGSHAMLGLGIGFSTVSTAMVLTPIIEIILGNAFSSNYNTILTMSFLTTGSLSLIGSIFLWIYGSILIPKFRLKKIELIKKYNEFIEIDKISLSLIPNFYNFKEININFNISFKI